MLWLGTPVRWWRDSRRRIFRFEVDGRPRWADPIRLCSAVEDACPDLDALLDLVRDAGPGLPGGVGADMKAQRVAAGKELVRVARVVFGLPAFDGTGRRPAGVTDGEAVGVLTAFVDWLADAAESARPTRSSSGSGPASPGGSTTGPTPDSTTPAS